MKKYVFAATLALAFNSVSAQNVEVYGKMRLYTERDKEGTNSTVTKQTNDTSRLGFRGGEDLGNGTKVFFNLETAIGADAPATSTLGDRASTIGLSTSLGRIVLGRDKHQIARTLDAYDPMENGFGTSAATIHQSQGRNINNGTFLTLTPVKGFVMHYQNSASETSGTPVVQAGGIDATVGSISASVAHYTNGLSGSGKDESTIYGAKFQLLPGTTLFGVYSHDTVDGAKTSGRTIGVQRKVSAPITLLASYGTKSDIKAYAMGASYAMSKRTSLHTRYRDENADAATSDRRQFGVGIEHNF